MTRHAALLIAVMTRSRAKTRGKFSQKVCPKRYAERSKSCIQEGRTVQCRGLVCNGLDGFAKTHFIGQDDIVILTFGMPEPVDAIQLIGQQLPIQVVWSLAEPLCLETWSFKTSLYRADGIRTQEYENCIILKAMVPMRRAISSLRRIHKSRRNCTDRMD